MAYLQELLFSLGHNVQDLVNEFGSERQYDGVFKTKRSISTSEVIYSWFYRFLIAIKLFISLKD